MKKKYRYICDHCGMEFQTSSECYLHEDRCMQKRAYVKESMDVNMETGEIKFTTSPSVMKSEPVNQEMWYVMLMAGPDVEFNMMLPESTPEKVRRILLMDEACKWLARQMNHVLKAKAQMNEIDKPRKEEKTGEND